MLVWQNMHTHTRLSYCGGRDSTVANTIYEAESVGLKLVGICDHIDEPGSGRIVLMQQNRDELAQIDTDVKVLIGSELSLNDPDTLPIGEDELDLLDYVLISSNHFHLSCVRNPDNRSEEGYADWFLTMAEGAIRFGASIIPHPFTYTGVKEIDGRPIDYDRLVAAYDRNRISEVFEQAARKGTAFELNPGHVQRMPAFFAEIIPMAREVGMKFAIGSDGHRPGSMHYGGPEKLSQIEELFRDAGLTEDDICSDFRVRRSPKSSRTGAVAAT